MKTTLYLVRQAALVGVAGAWHAAAPRPGVRPAELTRDLLAVRPVDACYFAPTPRAEQTALVLAEPHGLVPQALPGLADAVAREPRLRRVGTDGRRVAIADSDDDAVERRRRVTAVCDELLTRHAGQTILVVAPRAALAAYLAGLVALPPGHADRVHLDRCGISVVTRRHGLTDLVTLNATLHLQGLAA
jgi:broad specificity phosphatase PhoE